MHYTHIISLLAAVLVLSVVLKELFYYFIKTLRKRARRESLGTLTLVNPRKGRGLLHHTVDQSTSKLAWSLFMSNNRTATEGVKEFAEAQGLDNTCDYVDTHRMYNLSQRYQPLYKRVLAEMSKNASLAIGIVLRLLRKASVKTRNVMKCLRVRPKAEAQHNQTIKFIHNSGGVSDGTSDKA